MSDAPFPTTTSYEHVHLNEKGIPFIVGTMIKAEQSRQEAGPSSLATRLRDQGLLE